MQFENEREIEAFSQGPNKKYNLKVSTASFKISEIKSIIYGGKSSRFWILRKHLNSIKKKEFQDEKVPFFAWQCVTLVLPHREVDLVIENESMMTKFLQMLIFCMNTCDLNKDSATLVKQALYKQWKRDYLTKNKNDPRVSEKQTIRKKIDHQVMVQTILKVKILRIRMKISYHAFMRNITIFELFLKQITTTHKAFNGRNQLLIDNQDVILEFQDTLKSSDFGGCLQKIIKINYKLNPDVHGKNNFVK